LLGAGDAYREPANVDQGSIEIVTGVLEQTLFVQGGQARTYACQLETGAE